MRSMSAANGKTLARNIKSIDFCQPAKRDSEGRTHITLLFMDIAGALRLYYLIFITIDYACI